MPSLAEFLETLEVSRLVPSTKVEKLRAGLDAADRNDLAVVVRALVERRLLTKFQASKLLRGKSGPFFLGKYKILRQLGFGGMGKVYFARHVETNAKVALKVLPPKRAAAERNALARFQREADMSLCLSHPNVAETLDVGDDAGVQFLVMEYIPGQTLYDMVRDGGPLRVWDAARLFTEVAKGLGHIHRVGLIHRDIKPSNIMVTPDGDAKLLDLGLARHKEEEEQLTRPGTVVGTMDYVAPEQARANEQADMRSDIYALGCTLYFSIARRPPFAGGDMMSKIYRHRMEDPEPLEKIAKHVPREFAAVVRKMMAKEADDRYATAAELIDDLEKWTDPNRVRTLLGAAADSAQIFHAPAEDLDSAELHFVDDATNLRTLGNDEPAEAPVPRPVKPGPRHPSAPRTESAPAFAESPRPAPLPRSITAPTTTAPPPPPNSPHAPLQRIKPKKARKEISDEPVEAREPTFQGLGDAVFIIVGLGVIVILAIWVWNEMNKEHGIEDEKGNSSVAIERFAHAPARSTPVVSVPMPSIEMAIWSPGWSENSSGGTMPVPVSRMSPCGKRCSRASHATRSSGRRAILPRCVSPLNTSLSCR